MKLELFYEFLKSNNLTVSTAESCTGGYIANEITNLVGISDYFVGSIVCYMTRIKEDFLDIPSSIIDEYDVVSSEVSNLMAKSIQSKFESDIAISITGYIEKIAYYTIRINDSEHIYCVGLERGDRKENKKILFDHIINSMNGILSTSL